METTDGGALEYIHGAQHSGAGISRPFWIQPEGIGGPDCRCGCSRGSAAHAPGVSLVLFDQRCDWTGDRGRADALVSSAPYQGAGRAPEASAWAVVVEFWLPRRFA